MHLKPSIPRNTTRVANHDIFGIRRKIIGYFLLLYIRKLMKHPYLNVVAGMQTYTAYAAENIVYTAAAVDHIYYFVFTV